MEAWKDIPGFVGAYQVSSLGRVRSLDRQIDNAGSGGSYVLPGRVLKPTKDRDGYLQIGLHPIGGGCKTRKVHRLVLSTFRGVPYDFDREVDHRNGVRSDNRLRNLRWATSAQNKRNLHVVRSSTGCRGVRFRADRKNSWQAYINTENKFKSLGHFPTKELASAARAAAEAKVNRRVWRER